MCIGNRVRKAERKRKGKETEQTKDTIMSERFSYKTRHAEDRKAVEN